MLKEEQNLSKQFLFAINDGKFLNVTTFLLNYLLVQAEIEKFIINEAMDADEKILCKLYLK